MGAPITNSVPSLGVGGRTWYDFFLPMTTVTSLFRIQSMAGALPLGFALLLLVILVISFRSRAVVFCQYLETMTGIRLRPSDVRRVFKQGGKDGVRSYFLDLIIREDLKQGPLEIPHGRKADEAVSSR
jgi:hypothetical protein